MRKKPDALSNVPAIPLKIANVKNKYNHLSRPDVFTFIAGTVKRRFIKTLDKEYLKEEAAASEESSTELEDFDSIDLDSVVL